MITIPASGNIARKGSQPGTPCGEVKGISLYSAPTWGEVEGLPEPSEGTIYIVSGLVAGRISRPDVFSPGTGPQDGAVRENGRIVAVTRLIRSC